MFRAGAGGWHLWGHCSAKVAPSASLTRPPLKPPSISAAASQPEVPKLKKKKKKKAHGLSHFLQSAYDRSLYHSINPLAWRAQRQVEKTGSWRGRRTITQVGMTSPWAGYKAVRTNTQSLEEHLKSFGVKDGLRSLLCLTADWLLLAVPVRELQRRGIPERTHKTCQNELVVLGSVWTYGHPALSKDGGETFISVAAEGKQKSLIALFFYTIAAVYSLRAINRRELSIAWGVNSCFCGPGAQDCYFTHHISSFQSCLAIRWGHFSHTLSRHAPYFINSVF